MISRQIVIDALKASDHIITQHNLMSTASPQEVTETLNRLVDWRNGVVHLLTAALDCEQHADALRQVVKDAEQMSPLLTPTMAKPLAAARKALMDGLRAGLAALTEASTESGP